jgi:hypothetical protein
MNPKSDLRLLVKSAEDLAYALRDTLDVLADHERRIKVIEEKLGMLNSEPASSENGAIRGRVQV